MISKIWIYLLHVFFSQMRWRCDCFTSQGSISKSEVMGTTGNDHQKWCLMNKLFFC